MYRVFLGAPSATDIKAPIDLYQWQTVSEPMRLGPPRVSQQVIPQDALELASQRLSIYRNAIFKDCIDDADSFPGHEKGNRISDMYKDQTTLLTWSSTHENAALNIQHSAISQVLDNIDDSINDTQESQSYAYSETSSITRFPTFHFRPHDITPLSKITQKSGKVCVLVAVVEVDGPDIITIKKGPGAGQEIPILKLILADETGHVCKLVAWKEVAELWGGATRAAGVKRGDVILITDALSSRDNPTSTTLTASPNLKSALTICYRTLPSVREDYHYRPDIRLNDVCLRRVAQVVRWFEGMIGL